MPHYLDFAATSAVRPDAVAEAVSRYLADKGGTPGRGGHAVAAEASRVALRCRRAVLRLLGLPDEPTRLAFMMNATHGLNTALWGVLEPGDAVVVSQYDHNAVLRPVHRLARERSVEVRMLGGAPDGSVDLDEAARLLDGARLLTVNGASNVLGSTMPVDELTRLAHEAGALVLLDTAQTAGHLPPPMQDQDHLPDMVAFTGHKGLLGPQGTGGLWVRPGLRVEPLLAGGTGGDSLRREMPEAMPDRLEAGTVNAPGIAGLLAGCEYLLEREAGSIHARVRFLKARLRDGLEQIPGVRVLSPPAPEGPGIVTLVANEVDPSTLAERLEAEWDVLCRPGLHCAPEVHRVLGTTEGGALRLSLGWASSEEDVEQAVRGVEAIAGRATMPLA